MNFKEFLLEKKNTLEEQFAVVDVVDVDCNNKEKLTDEEKKYCKNRELLQFIRNAYQVNN